MFHKNNATNPQMNNTLHLSVCPDTENNSWHTVAIMSMYSNYKNSFTSIQLNQRHCSHCVHSPTTLSNQPQSFYTIFISNWASDGNTVQLWVVFSFEHSNKIVLSCPWTAQSHHKQKFYNFLSGNRKQHISRHLSYTIYIFMWCSFLWFNHCTSKV